jgi:outer membrane murein-binding lipoprotein Lpp
LVTSRILTRRRLQAGPHRPAPRRAAERRRRRSRRSPLAELAGSVSVERLRLSTFGRIYAAAGVLAVFAIAYLSVAAQVTQSSYEITQLQAQQADLQADRDALRYKLIDLHTPATVAQEAAASGLQRGTPSRYVPYQPVAIDLQAPTGEPAPSDSPAWQRAMAAVLSGLGISRDAMASER